MALTIFNNEIIPFPEKIEGQPNKFKITYRLVDTSGNLVGQEITVSPYDDPPVGDTCNGVTYTNLISRVIITDNPGSGEAVEVVNIPGGEYPDKYKIRVLRGDSPPPEESVDVEDPRP